MKISKNNLEMKLTCLTRIIGFNSYLLEQVEKSSIADETFKFRLIDHQMRLIEEAERIMCRLYEMEKSA